MSPEQCAENMIRGMVSMQRPGFHVMNERGSLGSKTDAHNDASKDLVWKYTESVLSKYDGK